MEYGFNIIPLTATAGTTVSCNFAAASAIPSGSPIGGLAWSLSTTMGKPDIPLFGTTAPTRSRFPLMKPSFIWWSSRLPSR